MSTYHPGQSLIALTFLLTVLLLTLLATTPEVVEAQRQYIKPIPVTATQLVTDYKNNFPAADAKYTGMLLLVTGQVNTILPPQQNYNYRPNKLAAYLTMDSGPNNRPLVIYLREWESQKVVINNYLRNGQEATIMGFCQGATAQLSLLDACLYPDGCGGPDPNFEGPSFKIPPAPLPPLGQ